MSGDAPRFDPRDEERIEEVRALGAREIFEVVRRDGEEELARPAASLAWSGLAAGLAIGFSVVAEAVIKSRLPHAEWAPLIADMGYTVGFILVVIGRLQLFTETTITPVMPICHAPTVANFRRLARLWAIVLAANFVGAVLFALFVMRSGAVSPAVAEAVLALGRHATSDGFLETLTSGIGAGFLIAALVWMLANSRSGEVIVIFIVTYVIAIAGFAHVVAGSVEIAALVIAGVESITDGVAGFLVPALIGNVIGGTVLFTLVAYGQIRLEIDEG